MPQQISKKILVYFFLFIIFGSLNNKNLAQLKFPNIEKIKIEGLEVENKEFQKSLEWQNMEETYKLETKKSLTVTGVNVRRIGSVDHSKKGVFLFNYFYLSTRALNSFPALKCGTFFSGTLTFSPVLGFLPMRGGR